jgi:tripartite-type tricarboxylate transporter receptor subunit TctC
VRLYVGFLAGGTTDILARLLAPALTESFGHAFYVDNRPGATGNIAAELTAKSAPDGHTLVLVPAGFASNVSVYARPGYDPQRDFAPIGRIAAVHNVMIMHPSLPARTPRELLDLARRNPGAMNFGSPGHGSTAHLALEMLRIQAGGINVRHVPYRGMAPAVLEVVGGHLHALMATLPPALPHIRSGRVRALAVASLKRTETLPQVPTFHESGFPGFEAVGWNALLAPAGTPYDVIVRLNLAVGDIVKAREFRERLTRLGMEVISDTPEEFTAYLRSEIDKWAQLVKRSGVVMD